MHKETCRLYRAYGLTLCANFELEGLGRPLPGARPDLFLELRPGELAPPEGPPELERRPLRVWRGPEGFHLRYGRDHLTGDFSLSLDGRRLAASFSPDFGMDSLGVFLQTAVLPMVLQLRGIPCLHASGVVCPQEGGVTLFMGACRAGKSTLAAALLRQGWALVTDDRAAVLEREGRFTVPSGPGRVHLWDETARGLLGEPGLPRLWAHHAEGKRVLRVRGPAWAVLRAVHVLGPRLSGGTRPVTRRLGAAEHLLALCRNLRKVPFLRGERLARCFGQLARLAQAVPAWETRLPDDLGFLRSGRLPRLLGLG